MRRASLLVAVAAILLLSGCFERRLSGHFGPTAYYHVDDHYRVRYGADTGEQLLPEDWTLEHFDVVDGRPTRYVANEHSTERVELSRYARLRRPVAVRFARWDLRFTRGEGRTIFVRTIPLRAPWSQDALSDLMLRSAVSLAVADADGPNLLGTAPAEVTPRIRLVEQGVAQVGGRDAYFITFDRRVPRGVTPIRAERVTLVGVRSRSAQPIVRGLRVPRLVVFGLVTTPRGRSSDLPAFTEFVRRVDFAPGF